MPPFVVEALNIVLVPAHIAVVPVVMETVGVTLAFTVIVTLFEVAVATEVQVAFEVKTQETICPFVKVLVVNVALFVPEFTPFTFH